MLGFSVNPVSRVETLVSRLAENYAAFLPDPSMQLRSRFCPVARSGYSHWLLSLLLAALCTVTLAPHIAYSDELPFGQAIRFGHNDFPESVAVSDFNGDGFLDIVQGNYGQSYIYLNDGQGGFAHIINLGDGESTQSVAVGDFNGDGFLDIIQGNDGQSYIYLNDGQGGFAQRIAFGLGESTARVVVGDFNSDGFLDMIQGNSNTADRNGQSYVYLNDGQGHFFISGSPLANKSDTLSLAVGDLNGDGLPDIMQGTADGVYIYLNHGQANLTAVGSLSQPGRTQSIAVSDLDGNGQLDIIQGNSGQNYIYLNGGQSGFASAIPLGNYELTQSVAVGDLNGDGFLDIVQANSARNYVYWNNRQGRFFTPSRALHGSLETSSLAVGDLNGDDLLDIAQGNGGQSYVYLNNGQGGFRQVVNLGNGERTYSVVMGDFNNDGLLDIAQGNQYGPSYIYLNIGQNDFTNGIPFSSGEEVRGLAVGDFNGDGFLDILEGNGGNVSEARQSYIYLNNGQGKFTDRQPVGKSQKTSSVAIGDFNGDGFLDIVQGNTDLSGQAGQSYVYLNDGQGHFPTTGLRLGTGNGTSSLAVGDFNGDGFPDIVQGNYSGSSYIYLNDGQGHFPTTGLPLGNVNNAWSIAVGDFNGDGFLDIVQGNYSGSSYVYLNDGQGHFPTTGLPLDEGVQTATVAVGDLNGDGLLDIVQGNLSRPSYVYLNGLHLATGVLNHTAQIGVTRPGPTANAAFFSTPALLTSPTIPITYTLFDQEGDRVGRVAASYSMDGGGKWLPAVATSTTITSHLTTAPTGVKHVFTWDTFASGFFGQSDNVVVRLVAYSQPLTTTQPITGSYRYTNSAAGATQWATVSATTFPFRVRGTQVRVVNEKNQHLPNALVYRLPAGQFSGATPLADSAGQPFRTNAQGYLSGRGALQLGDSLVALLPMTPTHPLTFTQQYSYFLTSAEPISSGLALTELRDGGVVTLTVPMSPTASTHPLLLFNLIVSLEWDASGDKLFQDQLKDGFQRASELLFKVTHGQAALGRVALLPAKSLWNRADLILYASNSLRPSAAIGGVVNAPMDERVLVSPPSQTVTKPLAAAYVPGQIRMGTAWDPFGEEAGDLSEQWWRALAHELSHHLFFLPDDYVGFKVNAASNQRFLGRVDCRGSFMTTTFDPSYARFLTRPFWTEDCEQTLASFSTGRSDWETITHFYPMLKPPAAVTVSQPPDGPNLLPLDVTHLVFESLSNRRPTLPARYFQLRSGGTIVRLPTARVYLFQTQGNSDPTDDILIALGSPTGGGDRIKVRGGQLGDRLCLFDFGASDGKSYTGCIDKVSAADVSIPVRPLAPGAGEGRWAPAIEVSALTTRTLIVTVTQTLSPNRPLKMQVFPAHYPSAPGLAPVAGLTLTHDVYVGQIALPYPASDVAVHVWVDDSKGLEAIAQFNLRLPWKPGDPVMAGPDNPYVGGPDNPYVGGPDNPYVGGPDYPVVAGASRYEFAAPMLSADSQVVIYNQDGIFEPNGIRSLQILPSPPELSDESWLVPVGQAYFVEPDTRLPMSRTIAVTYLQRDVPEGYEHTLTIYFLPKNGNTWQRLPTYQFVENLIVAHLKPEAGTYAVMSTIALPPLKPGLNLFSYPLPDTRPITTALASLNGYYSELYEVEAGGKLRAFPEQVEFGHTYVIKIEGDQPAIPYLAPPRRTPNGVVPGNK